MKHFKLNARNHFVFKYINYRKLTTDSHLYVETVYNIKVYNVIHEHILHD